ncbi:MAG: DNA repair protein RecO [Chloroflexia bacterium]
MSESRQRLYRIEGIVLRRSDTGEADRILTLYTPERGKLRLVARGVRRPGSRLSGHVELLTHSTFLVVRTRGLDIVTQAQTLHAFPSLRSNLERIAWGCYFAELLDRMAPEESANLPAFQLLLEALELLDAGAVPELLARGYELHLLAVLGFRPQLSCCVGCQGELRAQEHAFSALLGGVLCPRCRGEDFRARPLSLQGLKALRYLQRTGLEEATRLRLSPGCREEIAGLLHTYICTILERELHTAGFLDEIRSCKVLVPPGSDTVEKRGKG